MRLAVLNLTRKTQLNALVYGVLLGIVFTSIISFFVIVNQKIEFQNYLKFVASVEWVPGEHPGVQK